MNYKYIVVGVDGTGSRSWMKEDGSNSSTWHFVQDTQYGAMQIDRRWFNGPSDTVTGGDSEQILQQALDFVCNRLYNLFPAIRTGKIRPLELFDVNSCLQNQAIQQQSEMANYGTYGPLRLPVQVNRQMLNNQPLTTDDVRIVLVGHSRGGLIVTDLARMLSPLIRVYFMALYDSVDREPCLDGMKVENVKYVAHARRNPDVHSRTFFGNTSLNYIGVDHVDEQFFYTSHGGIGGSYVTSRQKLDAFGDTSCLPTALQNIGKAGVREVVNNPTLTRRLGKPMDQICADGSKEANHFIRERAKAVGIPIN